VHIYEVLKRPIDTERTRAQLDQHQYTFEVDARANKMQIKRAVEEAFDVTVLAVNVSTLPGKPRRHGRHRGHTSPWKKARVTLTEGDRIPIFEGT